MDRRIIASIAAVAGFLTLVGTVRAAGTFAFPGDFHTHDFDEAILKAMAFENASLSYFHEMAAITPEQLQERKDYANIGCYPFYVMTDGTIRDKGYNCQTFFCVGFARAPQVCQDQSGKAYGGIVELNRRLEKLAQNETETKTYFADFPQDKLTPAMKQRQATLAEIKCKPFYVQLFDVVIREGYDCESIGQYPRYSGARSCIDDLRTKEGFVCDVAEREGEWTLRREILGVKSSSSSVATSDGGASSSEEVTGFPDVVEGYYGYTAITALASKGIIKGYPDGTFKPGKTVNRAEFVKLFMNALHSADVTEENGCFRDVRDEWFARFVCAGKRLSWIAGYGDGTFRPAQTMRKAEALKVVVMSVDPSLNSTAPLPTGVAPDQWYSPYVSMAVEKKILLEPTFDPKAYVTRADAAVWTYRAMKAMGLLSENQ